MLVIKESNVISYSSDQKEEHLVSESAAIPWRTPGEKN